MTLTDCTVGLLKHPRIRCMCPHPAASKNSSCAQTNQLAAHASSTSSSCSMHKSAQQSVKHSQLLQKPEAHSHASSARASTSSSSSASQRLIQEALSVQAASLDCISHAACSPLSEHQAQCTVPSHLVPMMGGMVSGSFVCIGWLFQGQWLQQCECAASGACVCSAGAYDALLGEPA
jgi:hypothetical protein